METRTFKHDEVVTALLKAQGIHEGLWQLYVRFTLRGTNIGPSNTELLPAGIVAIQEIGITRVAELTNLAVDAAKANPERPAKEPTNRRGR